MEILFYKGTSIVSKIIRWQTRGIYSHAAMQLDDGRLVEAWEGSNNVRIVDDPSDGHRPGTVVDVFEPRLSIADQARVEQRMLEKVGAPYDYLAILRFVSRRRHDTKGRWFCSEAIHASFKEAGCPLLHAPSWKVSPVKLSWSTLLVFRHSFVTR